MEHCEQEPGYCTGSGAVIAGQRAVQRIYLSGDAVDRQYLAASGTLAYWRALGLLFLLYARILIYMFLALFETSIYLLLF